MLALAACGGGGGSGGSGAKAPVQAAAGNTDVPLDREEPVNEVTDTYVPEQSPAPVISGTPPAEARSGQLYAFHPEVTVADPASLVFGIVNKPAWADFNPANGTLIGIPGDEDIGLMTDIVITVANEYGFDELNPFSIDVTSFGHASVTLNWAPPTENEDGSTLSDLSGYKIYYGTSPKELDMVIEIGNPGLTSYVIDDLAPNTYFFAATAINADGIESERSGVAEIVVDPAAGPVADEAMAQVAATDGTAEATDPTS